MTGPTPYYIEQLLADQRAEIDRLTAEAAELRALLQAEADLRREFRAEIGDLHDLLDRALPLVASVRCEASWKLAEDIRHAHKRSTHDD